MMKKSVVSPDLRRAVDWKLFELISGLISDEVSMTAFEESKLWFQERHAQDVLEERFACGLCGNPLCANELKTYVKSSVKDKENGKRSLVTSDETKYRVDYATKEIYHVEKSKYYCSVDCLTVTETWKASLDGTSPYARTHLTRTLLSNESPIIQKQLQAATIPIDEVLNLLPSSSASSVSTQKTINSTSNTSINDNSTTDGNSTHSPNDSKGNLPPPPPFSHPHLSAEGTLQLAQIVQGKPFFLSENESQDTSKAADQTILRDNNRVVAATLAQAVSQLQNNSTEKTVQDTPVTTHVPVVKKIRPTALQNNSKINIATTTSSHNNIDNASKETPTEKPNNISETVAVETVDESNLAANNAINNDETVSEKATDSGKEKETSRLAGRGGVAAQAVSHRGAKTVQWDNETVVPTSSKSSTTNASVKSNITAVQKKKSTPLVALKIVERDNVSPLSAAALSTKREPSTGQDNSETARRDLASRIEGHSIHAKI